MRTKHKCQHGRYSSGSASVCINMRYARGNSKRWASARAEGIYHTGLTTHKRCVTRHTKGLAHQTWVVYNRWHGHKRQVSKNTTSVVDIETATQQPCGNGEKEVNCTWIRILGKYECWYRKYSQTLFHLSGVSEYAAAGKHNTLQGASQAMGGSLN